MFIVGVTGGIGSGKTAVTDIFSKLDIDIVDADLASRKAVLKGSPSLTKIKEKFGEDILLEDGNLNRARLRKIIFEDSSEKDWLEKLLHPQILEIIKSELEESKSSYKVLVSPLLFETGQFQLCHRTLLIDVSEEEQITRTTKRDKVTSDQVKKIINSQMSREDKIKIADDLITNEGSLGDLEEKIRALHSSYLIYAKQ
ncbi:MAG: dephospho-CoA kinase [Flavobacteriaceae bacterium]|jgi:dephospho-CoA kinase|nr:dephospho-CoA kinase [Flavobacteriaceae bacterium]|tara:strand:+ start:4776 stop:5372 length:597 start_codon:yes stop_codon:yes gene_type:complete